LCNNRAPPSAQIEVLHAFQRFQPKGKGRKQTGHKPQRLTIPARWGSCSTMPPPTRQHPVVYFMISTAIAFLRLDRYISAQAAVASEHTFLWVPWLQRWQLVGEPPSSQPVPAASNCALQDSSHFLEFWRLLWWCRMIDK
jgi:hypothetical protein